MIFIQIDFLRGIGHELILRSTDHIVDIHELSFQKLITFGLRKQIIVHVAYANTSETCTRKFLDLAEQFLSRNRSRLLQALITRELKEV